MRKEYLRSVAEVFISEHKDELKDFCFVFPNKHSSLFFKKYLSELTDVPLFLPSFTTINEFFGRLSNLVTLDKITLLYKLHCSFCAVLKDYNESFDDFLYWGDMILNDFDDIDKYMVDAQKLFSNIKDLKEIESSYDFMSEEQKKAVESFWGILIKYKDGDNEQKFVSLWSYLYDIYEHFRDSLYKEGYAYEGMTYRLVAERSMSDESFVPEVIPSSPKLVFVGLNALNKCEKTLFDRLQKEDIADFYWDYYGDVIKDPFNRSSMFMKSNVERYRSKYAIAEDGGLPEQKPVVNLISVPSAVGGAKYVHNILKEIIAKSSEDLTNTAIILPDEKLLFPLLNTIPEEIKHINVTMGYSLSNSSITPFIWAVASMQERIRIKSDGAAFYHKGVMAVLSSSFLKSICPEDCKELRDALVKENMIYVPAERLQQKNELFNEIFAPVLPESPEQVLFSSNSIAIYMNRVVEACAKFADNVDKEFLLGFEKCFNLLGNLPLKMKKETFFRMLRQISGSVSVPFSGEPLQGLQIMGPLETRCLDFDNIIMLSMNDGVFPSASVSNSIIPYNLRRGFNLPTYEYQDAVSAYYFYRSIARATNLYFIHDCRGDALQGNEVSRYIMQMEYHHKYQIDRRMVQYDLKLSEKSDTLVYDKGEEVMETLKKMTYSPSALLAFKRCPLKFYYQYVKRISEEEEVSEEVDSGTFGDIFHCVMENIYKDNPKPSKENLLSIANDGKYINELVRKGFAQKLKITEIEGKNTLVALLIADYVIQTLRTDADRAPFEVFKTEETYRTQLKFDGVGSDVNLKGIVDRVDFVQGFYKISDYKTGKSPSKSTLTSILPDHLFQLKFYLLLLNAKGIIKDPLSSELSIYYTREMYSRKIYTVKLTDEEFKGFKGELAEIFANLFNKDISFTSCEDIKECAKCSFNVICNRR